MHYRAQSHSAGYDSTQHCCDGSAVYPQCREAEVSADKQVVEHNIHKI